MSANLTPPIDVNSSPASQSHVPRRCYLPVVKMELKNNNREATAVSVFDSGSELSIITPSLCVKKTRRKS